MIRYVWEGKIAAGKTVQAAQWAVEQVQFVKKYDAIPPVTAFTNVFGDGGVLTFTTDYNDVEHYSKAYNQATSDPEYAQRSDDAAHMFVEGSSKVTMMRSL